MTRTARPEPRDPGWRVTVRTFAAGAACGFLAGAFVVATVVWQFGNVIGSRGGVRADANAPSAVDRWDAGVDDDPGVLHRGDDSPAAATTGRPSAPDAIAADTPVIRAPADSPVDLVGRGLVIPVEGIKKDQLTRQFSEKRGARMHEALDILAPRNTPVKAVEDGTIARLFFSKAGGITVYQFDPSGNYCYYYAHLGRYADGLSEGDRVKKGQVIGYVGSSGNAPKDAPHLHFAVFRLTAEKRWWEGTPLDPYDLLR
ncbi:MAG: M23 family metallopeptidase [Acidobacteria bacterium]|nr:M23 family metallopeptidase [Acidobacteriota bacterium]MCA1649666.1 M23 family metallopeptidase [Acidobacteriota bacterium]